MSTQLIPNVILDGIFRYILKQKGESEQKLAQYLPDHILNQIFRYKLRQKLPKYIPDDILKQIYGYMFKQKLPQYLSDISQLQKFEYVNKTDTSNIISIRYLTSLLNNICHNSECYGLCDKLYCSRREDNTCQNIECDGCGKIGCDYRSDHDYDLGDYDDRDW